MQCVVKKQQRKRNLDKLRAKEEEVGLNKYLQQVNIIKKFYKSSIDLT